jgi:very-short-patch-repair endonuclease
MSENKSNYNKEHKELARKLRKDGTKGEAILWSQVLRAKQFHGYQFNRQFCIEDYIVDFISRKLKLIIEVDGYSHNSKNNQDKLRDERLSELGYTVVRFSEKEIRNDIKNVIRVLESYLPDK